MRKTDKRVVVTVTVKGEPSDEDDEGVAGRYEVDVTLFDVDEAPSLSRVQAEGVREAALDAFHEKIGIACLDDFEITVSFRDEVDATAIGGGDPSEEEVAAVDAQAEFVGSLG